jgi:murein DD-endopeptidase MepM/ murein hydrolase activator NlpD
MVLRHEGADRYLTANAINQAVFRSTSSAIGSAFLATGLDFADALSGAALAGRLGSPLFVTRSTCIPYATWSTLKDMSPPARVILGNTAVVGEQVAQNVACGTDWAKPANGRITSGYGPRDPICTSGGCTSSFHYGVDLATGCNAPIYAASSGKITTAGWVGTYGNFIKIAHGSSIDTGYAHLVNGGILVRVGQNVSVGHLIGYSGTTGASTGCHLHFEVYQGGTRIDPVPFMSARGITFG